MTGVGDYEQRRLERIANNKKRMEELGLAQAAGQFVKLVRQKLDGGGKAVRAQRAAPQPRPRMEGPKRRSTRLEGRPAPVYNERALEALDGKAKSGRLPRSFEASTEEIYTEEHVKALGNYKEPWELFQSGYDESGARIYDQTNGKTCHQCRQKTLGTHTTCSNCHSLRGVLCGDCLFMRYGENVTEALANPEWTCPMCRDICNCSWHRTRKGWCPTGTLYRRAIADGYLSVAHYLVMQNLAKPDAATAPKTTPKASAKPAASPETAGSPAEAGASRRTTRAAAKLVQPSIDVILPLAKKGEAALAALNAKVEGKGGRPWLNQSGAAKTAKEGKGRTSLKTGAAIQKRMSTRRTAITAAS